MTKVCHTTKSVGLTFERPQWVVRCCKGPVAIKIDPRETTADIARDTSTFSAGLRGFANRSCLVDAIAEVQVQIDR